MSAHESLRFTLLNQQVVEAEGRPVGRIDDLVIQPVAPGHPPVMTQALIGAQCPW